MLRCTPPGPACSPRRELAVPAVLDEGEHGACVDAWLERAAGGLSPERLLELFEAAFAVLWARTSTPLGEVTMTAIAERVLYNASEKFPMFSSLEVDPSSGIHCGELRDRIGSARSTELIEGLRFMLVELLTVLGNLTAEILTPELHSELSRVVSPETRREEKTS